MQSPTHFSDAEQLLKAILAKKLNDTSYDELFKTTQEHREMIKAFRDTIWDVARENTIKARDLTTATKARIVSLERLIAQIGQYETDAKEQLEQAEENVEDIRAHVLNIQDDYKVSSCACMSNFVDSPGSGRPRATGTPRTARAAC